MSERLTWELGWIIWVGLALAAAVWGAYWRALPVESGVRRAVLASLRAGAVLAVAALLARPVRVLEWEEGRQRKVAVVLDGSRGVGFQVTRALQALGATVVMACPDRDTCARKTTALAAHFTPADGAWAITPMKLNMCSLPSIRAFAAAVSDKYARVDMLVLDSTSSCASNNSLSSSSLSSSSLSSSSPAAVRRVGDGSTCPQIFVAHTALVRWLGRLLVPQAPPHHNHTPSQYSSQAANSAASRDAGKNSQKSSSQSLLAASCSN